MIKSIERKPRAESLLKGLPPALQQELFEYMEGIGDEKGHTYADCVLWLEAQGIETSKSRLSDWRNWYSFRLRLGWSRQLTDIMVEDDQQPGLPYSDEALQRKGNRIFSDLALRTGDDKAWARTQSLVVRKQALTAIEKRLEFEMKKYADQRAKVKEVESEPTMTAEQKQERIRQIMGVD